MSKKPQEPSGSHPPHPRCPSCGKAMFKAMEARQVKKTEPWAYCRNKDCKLLGVNQAEASTAPMAEVEKRVAEKPAKKASKPEKPAKKGEPPQVTRARENIRQALAINGAYSKAVIGLTLTLVAQEMGDQDVANRLIDEFKLADQFGIQKQG